MLPAVQILGKLLQQEKSCQAAGCFIVPFFIFELNLWQRHCVYILIILQQWLNVNMHFSFARNNDVLYIDITPLLAEEEASFL